MLPDSILAKVLFMGGLFAAGLALGAAGGWSWASSRADAELAEQRDRALIDRLAVANRMLEQQQQAQALGEKLATQLDQTRAQLAEARVQLSRSVSRVTTVYKTSPSAAPQPLPVAVFTTGFVSVWNSAMSAASNQQTTASITDAASACDTADCLIPSGVTQADILTNHIDNALRCSVIAAQLNQLINWHEQQ